MNKIVLLFSFIILLSFNSYSQLTKETNFGTVRATCSDDIYIDLHNFTVNVELKGYMPGAPMNMFANDFTVKFITTFEAGEYFYDGKGNKASFDEIEGSDNAKVQIGYINVNINTKSSTTVHGKFNSKDDPFTSLIKGRTYTYNPYEWSKVIGAAYNNDNTIWKQVLDDYGNNFDLEIEQPSVELTHYELHVKYYFDQLAKKQVETKKLEEQYQKAMSYSTSNNISELNIALDLLNDIVENESATSDLTEKATQEILSIKFNIKFNNIDEKQENTTSTNENEEDELTYLEEVEEETTSDNKNNQSHNDNADRAAKSYSTCKELYRRGQLEAAKRCFEGHNAAYSCWDCNEYIRKITEEKLKQSAGQTAEAAAQVWVNFAEKADHFTLYIGYNYSPDRGDRGLEMQISPVYEMLYWGINFTYLEKRQYNFPFMYDDYENIKYWGVGTSAGFHGHLFSVKRKKGKYGKKRRLFSIEGRLGYGIYYGWMGSETSFEYYPEAYVSLNNLIGFGVKYISSIDGWANRDDYLGNTTFLDNMEKNKYFKGIRYSLFINFSDIF